MEKQAIKLAAQALKADKTYQWDNWEFPWELLQELRDITHETDYPVSMEEVESVLIALTKLINRTYKTN